MDLKETKFMLSYMLKSHSELAELYFAIQGTESFSEMGALI